MRGKGPVLVMSLLSQLKDPSQIKTLSASQLKSLAEEIRKETVEVVSRNGGHLSSNLGIVETTLALYHTFDFPKDKLIFDVGHQCYAHKMLSGRYEAFGGLRTEGGISGFPDANESPFDVFTTGHAGTSVSMGLGLCAARDRAGEDYCVINVVGDGSLVNGLNLEAIMSKDTKPKNYIVILNDNGMSISKNRNGFYGFISKSTTKKGYVKSKRLFKKVFGNSFITRFLRKIRGLIKRIFNSENYFEKFGFKYVGLCDGNDIKELSAILSRVKEACREKAVFLHIKTTKGKGLKKAEESSDYYHGVGKNMQCGAGEFSEALGAAVNALIEKDGRVMAVTAAMKDGTGLSAVEKKHPSNFFDVGIAEEFAVTFAAGMAKGGLKPIVAVYSTFLQRAYDEILHDVCLQNLPVVFCIDRAGLVGEDGKTHQGVFDLSYLRHIPGITLLAPVCAAEMAEMLDYALSLNAPVAIRYPKNDAHAECRPIPLSKGLWAEVRPGKGAVLLAVGPRMLSAALAAAEACPEADAAVIAVRCIKPLCGQYLDEVSGREIITLEENATAGGFGAAVAEYYAEKPGSRLHVMGVKDEFIAHGSVSFQLGECGLTAAAAEEELQKILGGK